MAEPGMLSELHSRSAGLAVSLRGVTKVFGSGVNAFQALKNDERGQDMVEYTILTGMIVVAVVTSIGKVASKDGEFTVGSGGPGQLTSRLRARLVAIQRGEAADPHGWVTRVG